MTSSTARGTIRSILAAAVMAAGLPVLAALATPNATSVDTGNQGSLTVGAPMTTTTPSATPPITSTATITPTVVVTPTEATPTSVATTPPKPAFLPLTLREHCVPPVGNIDVVFVLDGSSYMRKVRRSKPAWDTAQDMIRAMLAVMDFNAEGGQDQAAVVVVRHQAQIREKLELAASAATVTTFLSELEYGSPADTARMDAALGESVGILDRSRMPANRKVLVFVSELQPKNVPYRNEPGCEELDENCTMLKRADEVKARGITFIVFATGGDNRGPELMAMASSLDLALLLPSDEQIRATYQQVRPRISCPPHIFWPYRP